jgi:cytochrome c
MLKLSSLKAFLQAALLSLLMMSVAHAADVGTPAEAEALVKKAVALIKAVGPEKAYEEFTNGKTFKDRDLYIFVYDFNGKALAQGANPKLVGKELLNMKDADGRFIIQMQIAIAKEKGKGWTPEYKFINPVTQKIETKMTYVERAGDAYVACGVYKG